MNGIIFPGDWQVLLIETSHYLAAVKKSGKIIRIWHFYDIKLWLFPSSKQRLNHLLQKYGAEGFFNKNDDFCKTMCYF